LKGKANLRTWFYLVIIDYWTITLTCNLQIETYNFILKLSKQMLKIKKKMFFSLAFTVHLNRSKPFKGKNNPKVK